ncbi:MAG: S41 family peptidase [Desulfobulbaceae bacterium]|nr:S41 family peptidase [Desulfobulbaceae bacterium]
MKRIIALLFTTFLLCSVAAADDDQDIQREETYRNLEVFSNVLTLLQEHYVDPIKPEEVITGAINGMLTSLDPHSSYLQPEDFKALQDETQGSFSGIGIEITVKDNIFTVVSPIEDTPAYNAGIMAGDQIIRIDDSLTKDMTLMDVVKKLRGKKGTRVTISIFREGWNEIRDLTLIRDEIPVHSVKTLELEPELFYVRISNFQSNTTRDFRKALRLQDNIEPVNGLILDLRNNPGGLLDQAVKVADLFLDEGIIVSTRGRDGSQNMIIEAQPDDIQYTFPIIVMVNGGSASASEIVAGALQDHGRAIVLGMETFGKGSVQTIVPMPGGAGLRLTTARYYTPSGDSIQAKGIKPDIKVELLPPKTDGETEQPESPFLREKDLPNHFTNDGKKDRSSFFNRGESRETDGEQSEAAERLSRDSQLRTALFILKSLRIANTKQNGVEIEH